MRQQSSENNRNDDTGTRDEISRRLLFTRVAEGLSAIPVLGLGLNNALGHRDYATIDQSKAQVANTLLSVEGQVLAQSLSRLHDATQQLEDAYRDEYLKSRVVPHAAGGKGHYVRFRTEYYWDEERGAPDHSVIQAWRDSSTTLVNKMSELSRPDLLDTSKLGQLMVRTEHAGNLSQIGGSFLITAAGVTALLGYEEFFRLREARQASQGHEVESKEHLRRGFLKYGAAVAAAGASLLVAGRIDSRLAAGKERMEKAVESAIEQGEIVRESAIRGHFGHDPASLLTQVRSWRGTIQGSLTSGLRSQRVVQAMLQFEAQTAVVEQEMTRVFGDGVPLDLSNRCKGAIISKAIDSAKFGESSLGEFGVLLEGLAAGGAMTATIVASEFANQYLTAKIQGDS
jgi:hypothetical protein